MSRKSCSSNMAIPIILRLALLPAIVILALTISFEVVRASMIRMSVSSVNSPDADVDIILGMDISSGPYYIGNNITFTLTLNNSSDIFASSVVLTDSLPAGMTAISWSPLDCSGTNQVICELGTVQANSTITITIVTSTGVTGQLSNYAQITTSDTDTNPVNNSITIPFEILPAANLAVSLDASPEEAYHNGQITYTATVTNHGLSPATNVILSDYLPSNVSLDPDSLPSDCEGITDIACNLGSLAVNESRPVSLSVTAEATGTVTNEVTVESEGLFDPEDGNNSDLVNTPVRAAADLSLLLTPPPSSAYLGDPITYLIEVTNNGPDRARNIHLTSNLSAQLVLVSTVPPDLCSGTTILDCALGDLAVEDSTSLTLIMDSISTGLSTNSINVYSPPDPDPDLSNNNDEANVNILPSADLSVEIQPSADQVFAGKELIYEITVVNNGPSTAQEVEVVNTFPADVTFISSNPGIPVCIAALNTLTCNLETLVVGSSFHAMITMTVDRTTYSTITNEARVSAVTHDPELENNYDSETITVQPSADLSAVIQTTSNPAIAGQVLTYTVLITNTGPSEAKSVVLTDTLPVSVTLETFLPSRGTCTGGGVVICEFGSINTDASVSVRLRVNVPPEIEGTLINSAKVSGMDHDPDPENNTTSLETPVSPLADLAVTLSDPFDPISAGNDVIYEIAVSNNGPSTAKQVSIKNTFPDKVTFKSSDPVIAGCAQVTNTLTCPLGNIAPDSTFSMTITASVAPTVSGKIENRVEVSAGTNDPTPANNITSTITTVNPPTLAIQWTSPVASGENGVIYWTNLATITLSVNVTGKFGVKQVAFRRWDPVQGFMLIDDVDYSAPYSITIATNELNSGWNQVFAEAYDPYANRSNLWLWIVTPYKIYLPSVNNR